MLARESLVMVRDAPVRATVALYVATLAGFMVTVVPAPASYAGLGPERELFNGLISVMLVAGAGLAPWTVSRLTLTDRDDRLVRRIALARRSPSTAVVAKAVAVAGWLASLVIVATPFMAVAYAMGTIGRAEAARALVDLVLFLFLVSLATLHWTMRSSNILLSTGLAYGTMIALAAGRYALVRSMGTAGALATLAALDLLALYALARRANRELVYLRG